MTREIPEGWSPPFGILDTRDDVWMGSDKAPFSTSDWEEALYAEAVINEQSGEGYLKRDLRYQVRPMPPDINKIRDIVEFPRTQKEAIDRLERGA